MSIKLKSLLTEEKEAFKLEREGKLQVDIEKQSFGYTIRLYTEQQSDLDNKTYYKGYMNIAKTLPEEMAGNPMWKRGYLFVDHIRVNIKHEGYGYILYKTALKLAKEKGYLGLCSYRRGRSNDASNIWDKLVTHTDSDYDYLDIKDLGTRINEYKLTETSGFNEKYFYVGDCRNIIDSQSLFWDATEMAQSIENSQKIPYDDFIRQISIQSIPNGNFRGAVLKYYKDKFEFGRGKNFVFAYDTIDDIHYFFT